MTILFAFMLISGGFAVGLIFGGILGFGKRIELYEELDAAEAEIDRLRGA